MLQRLTDVYSAESKLWITWCVVRRSLLTTRRTSFNDNVFLLYFCVNVLFAHWIWVGNLDFDVQVSKYILTVIAALHTTQHYNVSELQRPNPVIVLRGLYWCRKQVSGKKWGRMMGWKRHKWTWYYVGVIIGYLGNADVPTHDTMVWCLGTNQHRLHPRKLRKGKNNDAKCDFSTFLTPSSGTDGRQQSDKELICTLEHEQRVIGVRQESNKVLVSYLAWHSLRKKRTTTIYLWYTVPP